MNLASVNALFLLLLTVFLVIFAFMGVMLLVKVINIMLGWNYGKRRPK